MITEHIEISEAERLPATAEALAEAHRLTLSSRPISPVMAKLVDDLNIQIQGAVGRKRKSSELIAAIGALLADMMCNPSAFYFVPLNPNAFTGAPIGYRPCKAVIDGMSALGFLDVFPGYLYRESLSQKSMATRFRLRPEFLNYAASHGVRSSHWQDHFSAGRIPDHNENPIQLRAKTEGEWNQRIRGDLLPIRADDAVAVALGRRVNEINLRRPSFTLWAEDVERGVIYQNHKVHTVFFRGFNQGDGERGCGWNRGGRLYPIGGGYQQFSKAVRSTITFDGEASVEIDLRASHLTILYGINGVQLCFKIDPYSIDGFPRPIVKAWVTMTLGHRRFHRRWHPDAIAATLERHGVNLNDYSFKAVQAAVLDKHPLLKEWEACPLDWGDLQYLESKVIEDTVHALTVGQGIPALPVHDSIIVPVS